MPENRRRPIGNQSKEAQALRQAALEFASQPEEPIDVYDTLGVQANTKLLRAAIAYAKLVVPANVLAELVLEYWAEVNPDHMGSGQREIWDTAQAVRCAKPVRTPRRRTQHDNRRAQGAGAIAGTERHMTSTDVQRVLTKLFGTERVKVSELGNVGWCWAAASENNVPFLQVERRGWSYADFAPSQAPTWRPEDPLPEGNFGAEPRWWICMPGERDFTPLGPFSQPEALEGGLRALLTDSLRSWALVQQSLGARGRGGQSS